MDRRLDRLQPRQHLLLAFRRKVPAVALEERAGLGQVNLGYHAHRYTQPCELLDPYRNLAVAAEILREQHTPGEDWLLAIGRYHRPAGGAPAARYRRSLHQHLTLVIDPGVPVPTPPPPTPLTTPSPYPPPDSS